MEPPHAATAGPRSRCLHAALAASCVVPLACATATERDVAAVEAAVAAHWAAINDGDGDAVMSHHTTDITLIVADFEPRIALDAPEAEPMLQRWEGSRAQWTVRDLQVQLLGDVAVATFYLEGAVTWADGTRDARRRRVTEVWVKEGGVWKEAHHHDSAFTGL